jgi:hypothetical protein
MADKDADKEKEQRTRGVVYRCLIVAVFVCVLVLADSDCRKIVTWTFTADCASHAATSGEIALMFAAVYAVFDPKAFVAVFGGLLRAIGQTWARIGRQERSATQTASTLTTSGQEPTPQDHQIHSTFRPSPASWRQRLKEEGPPFIVLLIVAATLLVLPWMQPLPLQPPSSTSTRPAMEGDPPPPPATTQSIETEMLPQKLTIAASDTCVAIARRHCSEERWDEFATHNGISVLRRGTTSYCDIHPGERYELPPGWSGANCSDQ